MRFALFATVVAALGCGDGPNTPTDARPSPDLPPEEPVSVAFEAVDLPESPAAPTALVFLPDSEGFLVAGKRGEIHHYSMGEDGPTLVDEVQLPDVSSHQECGLVGLAIDPEWTTNRFVYGSHCLDGRTSRIVRVTMDGSEDAADSVVEVFRVGRDYELEGGDNQHTMTSLFFDDTGALVVMVGDRRNREAAQDPDQDLGSIVRLVPSRVEGEGGATGAPDNPYAPGGGSPNVWAKGVRSPWKAFLDSRGRIVVGDVGGACFEELNVVDGPGRNLGWPLLEGPCGGECGRFVDQYTGECEGMVDPVLSYDRSSDHAFLEDDPEVTPIPNRAVYAALEHRSPVDADDPYDDRLAGRVIWGDAIAGFVRAARFDETGALLSDRPIGHIDWPTAWGEAPDGHVYVMTYGSDNPFDFEPGLLFRMVLR